MLILDKSPNMEELLLYWDSHSKIKVSAKTVTSCNILALPHDYSIITICYLQNFSSWICKNQLSSWLWDLESSPETSSRVYLLSHLSMTSDFFKTSRQLSVSGLPRQLYPESHNHRADSPTFTKPGNIQGEEIIHQCTQWEGTKI